MLKGTRDAILRKVQPVSFHGQISLDLHFEFPDEPGVMRAARVGPEAVPRDVQPGDSIRLEYLLGTVTAVTKIPDLEHS